MRRRLLAVGALALLAVLAGCAGPFGGGGLDTSRANETASYDWETTANSTLTVEGDRVLAVYRVENRSTLELYGFRRFGNLQPLDPVAARFRYPNGTVVGPAAMSFSTADSRTVVELPAEEGRFAVALPKEGKRVRVPIVVEGSHELLLPEDAHVRYFLLGRVVPSADERTEGPDDRVRLRWEALSGERLVVEYYLERDLVIFAAVLTLAGLGILGGLIYFWLQLRTLRERRQQVAWDEDSGGP
ncbi:MAG: DUF5803 family protein [Halobacteriales archaeon]|nr:DUF5803 family protein [Halobacteriales archaeon]